MIENFVKDLPKYKKIDAVYLFGSYLNNFGNLSDIDFCIIGNLGAKEKKEILRDSPELFDVSFFEELPNFIRAKIFSRGRLIYLKKGANLDSLKYSTLTEYRDFMFFMKKRVMEKFKNV